MPGKDAQPVQEIPGWRLWISATGRHWALRCTILTAAQVAAGARPLLWAEDGAGLAALISEQHALTTPARPVSAQAQRPGRP